MSFSILKQIGDAQKKKAVVDVRSGDTVKVTQKIKEGNKFRLQTFEGVVIRVERKNSHTERIVVRKVTSGVGVEKSYLVHSPLVEKIEITKRAKVRRNNLSYLRQRSGKSARLASKDFDRAAVNDVTVKEEAEETLAEADEAVDSNAKAEDAVAVKAEDKDIAEAEADDEADNKDAKVDEDDETADSEGEKATGVDEDDDEEETEDEANDEDDEDENESKDDEDEDDDEEESGDSDDKE